MYLLTALIKTLTINKIKHWLFAQWAFIMVRLTGNNISVYAPPFVTIEPTNRCNLRCPECATGSQQLFRAKGDMSLEDFKTIVDKIAPYTIVLNIYMQGEPFLNKSISEMIAYAKHNNLFVSLSTNANVSPQLDEASLPHHLIVSADGATQKTYEAYRVGGKLEKVKQFTKRLSEWKNKTGNSLPCVELQYLVNKQNENEIEQTKRLFKGEYDRFVLKTMQIIHPENNEIFEPTASKHSRYKQKKALKKGCYKLSTSVVITQDSKVAPCCMDKDATYAFGELNKENYVKLINNEASTAFRKQIATAKSDIDICQNCPFA